MYRRYIENTYITKNWSKLENNNKPLIFKKRHFHVFRKHERVLNSFFFTFFYFFYWGRGAFLEPPEITFIEFRGFIFGLERGSGGGVVRDFGSRSGTQRFFKIFTNLL